MWWSSPLSRSETRHWHISFRYRRHPCRISHTFKNHVSRFNRGSISVSFRLDTLGVFARSDRRSRPKCINYRKHEAQLDAGKFAPCYGKFNRPRPNDARYFMHSIRHDWLAYNLIGNRWTMGSSRTRARIHAGRAYCRAYACCKSIRRTERRTSNCIISQIVRQRKRRTLIRNSLSECNRVWLISHIICQIGRWQKCYNPLQTYANIRRFVNIV